MAAPKNVRITTPAGIANYPHLTQPDEKFDAAGVFHTKLIVEAEEAEDVIETMTKIRDEFYATLDAKTRKTHTLVDVVEEELDDEGAETGNVVFKAKMVHNVTPKNGKPFTQTPMIFDSFNKKIELEGLNLGSGSQLRLNCEVVPYAMASTKMVGVSLRLKAVQIVELVGFGGSSPFDEYEGGESIEDSAPAEDETPFDGDDDDNGDF